MSASLMLTRLLDYIEEQAKDVDTRSFRLDASPHPLFHPRLLRGLPGVRFDVQRPGDHVWLQAERLEAISPPTVPAGVAAVLTLGEDPAGPVPSLNETALAARIAEQSRGKPQNEAQDIAKRLRFAAATALAEYMPRWVQWAEVEKPRRRTIDLYNQLFAIKHTLEAEETANPIELVWGVGRTTWRLGEVTFDYPVLTQQVELDIDPATMALSVRPRAVLARYEGDVFAACNLVGAADVEKTLREALKQSADRSVSPFDPSSYEHLLRVVAGSLDSQGTYLRVMSEDSADARAPTPGAHLVVTDAWVLLVRPRSNNYLIEDLHRLKENLGSGVAIPGGPAALVTPPSDAPIAFSSISFRGLSSRGKAGTEVKELYFPLPYNDEQVTIVQQLSQSDGVTVQGPPGTGKSHTIANIVCHYLAQGKKVLVTSKGEPALEVLQEKIPEEVRPLTVALLTNDREGMRQFQTAIETIQAKVSQLNPDVAAASIEQARLRIDQAHAELARIDTRVDEIALGQLSEVELDGQPMRAQQLAQLVVTGQAEHGWFDDAVTFAAEHAPPLSDEEARRLREVRRALGQDLVYVTARVPAADSLPTPEQVAQLHDVLVQMRGIQTRVETGDLLPLRAATLEVLNAAAQLMEQVGHALRLCEEIDELGESWAHELRLKCRLPSLQGERVALEALFEDITHLIEARGAFLQRPVEMPVEALKSPKALEAVARGAETGKPFGMLAFGAGDAKELLAQVTVAGVAPQTPEDWKHVQRHIALHTQVVRFVARWNQFAPALAAPSLQPSVAGLRRLEMVALAAKKAHRLATHYDVVLLRQAEAVFAKPPVKDLTGTADGLARVREHLRAHLTKADLARAAAQLATFREKLAGTSGPVSAALVAFIDRPLGAPATDGQGCSSERVAAQYASLLAEVRRVQALAVGLLWVSEAAARIEQAGAPRLAARIRTEPVGATGEDAALPTTWRQAWTWARVRSYLAQIEAREELVALAERRRNLEAGLARLYREMVAQAAWLSAKRNASHKVLEALQGYATAIRRIGQGTGPNAVHYRRDAREHMFSAVGAVPCWIMSHAKVSESVPAEIGKFDLVIVDEASQSDLWALPAVLRGKKLLVVGDDKQVSPDGSFISGGDVQALRERFLADQPFKEAMTPDKSLYDLAARVFAAHQVMLREHFRCVPPIIAYSNKAFYGGEVKPLRVPKGSERLDPPLVDVLIPHGVRSGKVNREEADFIAVEIAQLLADERFAGRSLGVVTLLGIEQTKLIDERVRRRCNGAELMRRRFECGEPAAFQGSERDIMFLSLVVDPANCHAVSGLKFEQRFNVAASRARDRMYLVRSVEASHLSDSDLRRGLLQHFHKPLVVTEEEAELLIDRCESGFEREVFKALTQAGYKVQPQVQTGAYRIDMVVEGAGDLRLAIECDGDEFHGPDRWPHDMARQRALERVGWTFWRCFASTWSLRREEVLAELMARLTAMGIEPLGAAERAPSLVERRVVPSPQPQPQAEAAD